MKFAIAVFSPAYAPSSRRALRFAEAALAGRPLASLRELGELLAAIQQGRLWVNMREDLGKKHKEVLKYEKCKQAEPQVDEVSEVFKLKTRPGVEGIFHRGFLPSLNERTLKA